MSKARLPQRRASAQNEGGTGFEAIFGPPPVLMGEDPDAFQALLAQVTAAVGPRDILEQIWVRDVVDATWEIMRLRRLRVPLIVAGYGEAWRQILAPGFGFSRAAIQADDWLSDKKGVREAIAVELDRLGLSMNDVHARALAHKIDAVERVDRLTANAEHRRRLIFDEIDRHRETLARRLREAAQTIDGQLALEEARALPPTARSVV